MKLDPKNKNYIFDFKINHEKYDSYVSKIDLLSSDELKKYNSYKNKNSQITYLISHLILRDILGSYLYAPPQSINFMVGDYGKPFLKDYPDLHFNLSHSKNKVLIIICDSEVGVDVEYIDPYIEYLDVASNFFSSKEWDLINTEPNIAKKRIKFFELWTQKEALLKCLGTGLIGDIKNTNLEYFNKAATLNEGKKQWYLHTLIDQSQTYVYSFAYKSHVKKQFLHETYFDTF